MADASVVRNDEKSRYEIWADEKLAGFADYRERADRTIFTHTEIGDEFGGRGLGKILATEAVKDADGRDRTIVPLCPFIAAFLKKNPDAARKVDWSE
ncbi:N-acetyltransferase [Pseudonocardiaceae bacterium YIM PH 21723]|nr:N-acetyltransferase [Pseudonocardiaceae bacterium YIM PH 21723]